MQVGQLAPGPQPTRGHNLRNSLAKPHQNWENCKALRDPFRGILNALEYCPPIFSLCCLKIVTSYWLPDTILRRASQILLVGGTK